MNVLTGVDMSEITNKELANLLFGMSECNVLPNTTLRQLKLAAERLEAMPDGDPIKRLQDELSDRLGFGCVESCIQKAESWGGICEALDSINPTWRTKPSPTLKDNAIDEICRLYDMSQPQQPAPDVTIKDLRELINHFYDRRPDTSTNLLADEILNKYKVTQKC